MTATERKIILLLAFIMCPACLLEASIPANTKSEIMKAYADKLYDEGDFPGALSLYISTMEKAESENDNDTYMACIGNIANIYEALGDYESNLFYLLKGYDMSRRLKNNDLKNKYLTNIVAAYCNLGDVEKAKKFYGISKSATAIRDTASYTYFLILGENDYNAINWAEAGFGTAGIRMFVSNVSAGINTVTDGGDTSGARMNIDGSTLHVSCGESTITGVSVYSTSGATVYTGKANGHELTCDLSSLTPGVYMAKVTTAAGTSVRKFVVK